MKFQLGAARARGATRRSLRSIAAPQRQPGLTGARMNLAVAYYRAGNPAAAEAARHKALEYEPDLDAARRMLAELRTAK